MIRQLANAPFVRAKLRFLLDQAAEVQGWISDRQEPIFPDLDEDEPGLTTEEIDSVRSEFDQLFNDGTIWDVPDGEDFHPHDDRAAILISALDETYHRSNVVLANPDPEDPFDEIVDENEDPLRLEARGRFRMWASSGGYYIYARVRRFHKKSLPFRPQAETPVPIANDTRMVLFGDWGSGIRDARILAQQIRKTDVKSAINNQHELHVIHLGDAYHAGRPREYAKRFTPYWPVDAKPQSTTVFSWTVPGNHDMYSGNRGFYQMLDNDPRFGAQNKCSYFLLENDYWQVFGLDTASDPQDPKGAIGVINDTQINWIGKVLNPAKRWILLTHHQPFCVYSKISDALAKRLDWVLKQKQVAAWFWGHDHHCAVYKLHPTIGRPVLLGHGGYPEKPKTLPAAAPIDFEWNVTYKTRFLQRSHLKFGYAALHFQNNSITARLIDSDGNKQWNDFTIS